MVLEASSDLKQILEGLSDAGVKFSIESILTRDLIKKNINLL